MKNTLLVFAILALFSPAVFSGNYTITVDGKNYDLSLGEETQIKIGGKSVPITVTQKDNVVFETGNFSFQHPSKYAPARNDLGDGIYQTAMFTPLGTVVMVQEYLSINPTMMIDLMVNEVTKEEREYGYDISVSPANTTLSSGAKLNGKMIESKYKDANIKRYIYTYGAKDSGLLIMTQLDYSIAAGEESLIKQFFDSFTINMQ